MTEQKETFEEFRARKQAELQPHLQDTFQGDDARLIASVESLIAMDLDGVLVPHGIGGTGRSLLASLASRLRILNEVMEHVDPAQLPGLPSELRFKLGAYAKPAGSIPRLIVEPTTPDEHRALSEHLNSLKREQLVTDDQSEAKAKLLTLMQSRRSERAPIDGDHKDGLDRMFSDIVHERAIDLGAIGEDSWFEFDSQEKLEEYIKLVMQDWLPTMIEGTEVSVDLDSIFGSEGRRLFGTVTCAQEHNGHNGVILLMQEPEPNWNHFPTREGVDADNDPVWTGRFEAQGQCMISSTTEGVVISNGARVAFLGPREVNK